MKTEPRIKIFLSYHKNCDRIRSDILTPIHVGRAISSDSTKKQLEDIIGDDTGDNISEKNQTFCELTAQYWAWKNCDADYIGFFHYRRHLAFNDVSKNENKWGVVEYPCISKNYLNEIGLSDDFIQKAVNGHDIVTVRKWDVTNAGSKNNYDHYASSSPYLHINDYDLMVKLMLKKHPDYEDDVRTYNSNRFGFYTNMYIMRSDVFHQYCEFLFDILFELEDSIDISEYNTQEKRIFGYLSEWMFGIYLTHYRRTVSTNVTELPRTFIRYPDIENGKLHYISSCDDNYAKHLGVLMTSIRCNKGDEKIIHWILSNGISPRNTAALESIKTSDYDVRIIDFILEANRSLEKTLETNPHLSLAAYSRLFITDCLPPSIHKVLYLDCDMVCRTSLSDLYAIETGNSAVCGVEDILVKANTRRLGIDKYVNSGVLLINLDKWRELDATSRFQEYILTNCKDKNKMFYQDQDVINSALSGKIEYIDCKWNAQTSSYEGCELQNQIGKTSAIVHFISDRKPWIKGSNSPFEEDYRLYLGKSPWSNGSAYTGKIMEHKQVPFKNLYVRVMKKVVDTIGFNALTKILLIPDLKINDGKNVWRAYDRSYLNTIIDKHNVLKTISKFAEQGNPHAMVRMARAYKDAHGTERDVSKSMYWFKRTYDSGVDWVKQEFKDNLLLFYNESIATNNLELQDAVIEMLTPFAESGDVRAKTVIFESSNNAKE